MSRPISTETYATWLIRPWAKPKVMAVSKDGNDKAEIILFNCLTQR